MILQVILQIFSTFLKFPSSRKKLSNERIDFIVMSHILWQHQNKHHISWTNTSPTIEIWPELYASVRLSEAPILGREYHNLYSLLVSSR